MPQDKEFWLYEAMEEARLVFDRGRIVYYREQIKSKAETTAQEAWRPLTGVILD